MKKATTTTKQARTRTSGICLVEITKNFDQVFIVGDRMINSIQDCKNFLLLRAFIPV